LYLSATFLGKTALTLNAHDLRRDQDQLALEALLRSQGELEPQGRLDCRSAKLTLSLRLPVLAGAEFPLRWHDRTGLEIRLPLRYPFEPPSAKTLAPVWHPNVFANGNICLGSRWQTSEGLDLFVARIARLLIFDPMLVNLHSVANHAAALWYAQNLNANQEAFPSVKASAKHWLHDPRADNQAQERVLRSCPNCQAKLRLAGGRIGIVQCPRCRQDFEART
jgi:hypothetical protein